MKQKTAHQPPATTGAVWLISGLCLFCLVFLSLILIPGPARAGPDRHPQP